MRKIFLIALFLINCISISYSQYTQVFMDADSSGDAYTRIDLKGYAYEVPDCGHPVRHINEKWDNFLHKFVFKFTLHKDLDNDRCINFDRQRCEIKTYGPSPENMKASEGETHTYRWKFKLDSLFQPSPNFCHIHQLKAGDGPDDGLPLITITPRYSSQNKLQLIFTAPTGWSGSGTLKQVNLAPFLGTWVEAFEKVKYDKNGTYQLVIRNVKDDSILFSYSNNHIAMWRIGSTFIRPKYGIYRSLNSKSYLRDESILYADFYLVEGDTTALPSAPGKLIATALSDNQIELNWVNNSDNGILFRIDRSLDSLNWAYRKTVSKINDSYIDSGLAVSRKYFYRVRCENTFGNSDYSNVAYANTLVTTVNSEEKKLEGFNLENYPNPFNPSTTFVYTLPVNNNVSIIIYDINGEKITTLINKFEHAGSYKLKWTALSESGKKLVSGIYFAKINADKFSKTIKLLLVK